jgi:formylglycine-generating enzyme required for sulfatase activity
LPWERHSRSERVGEAECRDRAQRLLRLLSPAIRIEPGLLRAIRLLLREASDAGTEADVWQHRDLIGRSRVAGTLDATAADRLRKDFAALESREMQNAVIERLQQWRAGLRKEVWDEELLSLHPETQAHLPDRIRDNDLPAARERLKDLASELASRPGGLAWYRRLYRRVPDTYHSQDDPEVTKAQHRIFHAAFRDVAEPPPPPPDYDPASIPTVDADSVTVDLHHAENRLVARRAPAAPALGSGPGSLVCSFETRNREILIKPVDPFWVSGSPPPWASAWSRDRYGLWVAFTVEGTGGLRVTQRLRWIPPGRFLMGSPEDEPERWNPEGPQHAVTMANGFWLFDTACTQALWQAVMSDNPSRFQSVDRPVEQVSWDDVQEFLTRINGRVPGLELRLPSEAEWEYACRAGTKTPFSFGDTITPEQVNYNGSYPYAGGKEGLYRGETVPVTKLPANPWGLYEMHGNVDEWCEDHWHSSYEGAPADGRAWIDATAETGADRVIRGGSWFGFARYVRSAYRFRLVPGSRIVYLGFRCARVQDGAEPWVHEAEHGRAEQVGQAERPTASARPNGAMLRRLGEGNTPAILPIPAAPAFVLATDCERLTFRQIMRPKWARAIGRDRFGLWTEIEVRPKRPAPAGRLVRQRLRWISPGRFVMGSPEGEAGRFEWEGPQHEVTIAAGFWLFDTPCTQALWQVVMGENPSRFQSPDRPVETVSWDDAQEFLKRINESVPGLQLSLPSEALWEYACRAGTTTALYTGEIDILGQCNAPALGPIAWYSGNSGADFDLDNWVDSSEWPEKQYDHTRAGTHPVKRRAPNAWGLYDMLGNVWEWCADHWHDSYEGARADGSAWLDAADEARAHRVIRGGSWVADVRGARSAFRYGIVPGDRDDDLGFRCARVQDGTEPSGQARGAAATRRGGSRRKPKEQVK